MLVFIAGNALEDWLNNLSIVDDDKSEEAPGQAETGEEAADTEYRFVRDSEEGTEEDQQALGAATEDQEQQQLQADKKEIDQADDAERDSHKTDVSEMKEAAHPEMAKGSHLDDKTEMDVDDVPEAGGTDGPDGVPGSAREVAASDMETLVNLGDVMTAQHTSQNKVRSRSDKWVLICNQVLVKHFMNSSRTYQLFFPHYRTTSRGIMPHQSGQMWKVRPGQYIHNFTVSYYSGCVLTQPSRNTLHFSDQVSRELWTRCDILNTSLVGDLTEKLRLILEPSLAKKLSGDYRSGKRINMRKVRSERGLHLSKEHKNVVRIVQY